MFWQNSIGRILPYFSKVKSISFAIEVILRLGVHPIPVVNPVVSFI